jgi:hypothetical protein
MGDLFGKFDAKEWRELRKQHRTRKEEKMAADFI